MDVMTFLKPKINPYLKGYGGAAREYMISSSLITRIIPSTFAQISEITLLCEEYVLKMSREGWTKH